MRTHTKKGVIFGFSVKNNKKNNYLPGVLDKNTVFSNTLIVTATNIFGDLKYTTTLIIIKHCGISTKESDLKRNRN